MMRTPLSQPPRPFIAILLAALMLALPALLAAAPRAQQQQDADEPQTAEQWLEKLEQRGREIDSFQARVVLDKQNKLLGDRQIRIGDLEYLAGDPEQNQPDRFAARFKQLLVDGKVHERRVDYIFDGSWLVERNVDNRLFIKRQVVPPGEQLDPLRIDGPFPVPIGQEKEAILQHYNVELVPPEAADASGGQGDGANNNQQGEAAQSPPPVHLRLTPKADAAQPDAGQANAGQNQTGPQFQRVDLWFDRQTLLPEKVETIENERGAGAEKITTVTLRNIRVNELSEEEAAARFDTSTPEPGSGWRVEVAPWQQRQ